MNSIFINSLLVISASLFFVINDAIINYLSPKGIQFYHFVFYGAPPYLLVPLYLIYKRNFIEKLKCKNYFIVIFRSLLFLPMPYITFISLKNITLPEFTTLNMSAPIFAILYGFFLLKEKMNLILFFSLSLGSLGVLFVIQPGFDAFNYYFLLVLFGAFIITGTTVIVNKYNYITTSIGFFIYGGISVHLLSLILFIYDPLAINIKTFLLITIASILINTAMLLMTVAMHNSQKYYSSIFCLVYIQILWSILIGYIIFNEVLNFYAILGAILIVFSGILSVPSQYMQKK